MYFDRLLRELDLHHRRKGWVVTLTRESVLSVSCDVEIESLDGSSLIRPVSRSDWSKAVESALGQLECRRAIRQREQWESY